ncbi:MAG: hypothetical protein RLZZ387_4431 [Chloroflexota bacterium]
MSSLRERRKQMLRDEIIEAAQSLIAEKGYGAMSMDELAAHVGISKPTLYSHFATKGDLVVEAATRELRQMAKLIESQPEERSPLERLAFVMQKILERQLQAHSLGIGPWPEVFRLLCEHESSLSCMQQLDRYIVAQVQAGMAHGEIDPALDEAAVVRAFYGMASAVPHGRITAAPVVDLGRTADALVAIFVRGVRRSREA